jgi:hypothetical protein
MELLILLLLQETFWAAGLERLQVFAWLEPNGLTGRDVHFRTGPGVPADARFSRLDRKYAKTAQLYPIVSLQGILHAIENGIDCLFRFCLAHSRPLNNLIHEIEFDHWNLRISFVTIFLPSGDALGNAN